MDPDAHADALVAPLRADTVSGAAVVARTAAEIMRRAAVRLSAASLEEFRWGLGMVALGALDAQPSMAPLVRLIQDVLAAASEALTLEDARHAAVDAAEAFRDGLDERAAAVAERAAKVLPPREMIATISYSSTVREALLAYASDAAEDAPTSRVLCFESRPMEEGRSLADSLAGAGVAVTLAIDAAAFTLLPQCGAVLLGADSIGDRGVVNKIGSVALAHAAAAADVRVYVVCDETKILPPGFPQVVEDDRPGSEIWKAPAGVKVWNRYFEVLSLDLVTGVVTEAGVLAPEDLEVLRAQMPFPDFLRRWAEAR